MGNIMFKGSPALAALTMKLWTWRSLLKWEGHTASSLPWTSRKKNWIFRGLLGRVLCDKTLERRGAQGSFLILEDHLRQKCQEACEDNQGIPEQPLT